MKSTTWIGLGVGTLVGGLIGYTIMQDARAQQLAIKYADQVRLPEPSFGMQLPQSAAEFELLQQQICACIASPPQPGPNEPAAGALSHDEHVEALTYCVAKRLYRSFPWPPVPGDHPSASRLWDTIEVLIQLALATGDCDGAQT